MTTVYFGDNSYSLETALAEDITTLGADYEVVWAGVDKLTADGLVQLLTGVNLFSANQAVILNKLSEDKLLWDSLGELLPRLPDEQPLFVVEPNIDKRTKTYKVLSKIAKMCEFKQLSEPQLVEWLQVDARSSGANIEVEAARFMVRYVGANQARLAGELSKLVLFGSSIDRQMVEKYCQPTPEASAYEVIDLIVSGDRQQLAGKLGILSGSEDPYMFFGLVSSQVVGLLALLVAGQRSTNEAARDLSLSPYALGKLAPLARRLDIKRVRQMLTQLAETDMQIKTSSAQPWQAIELVVLKLATS